MQNKYLIKSASFPSLICLCSNFLPPLLSMCVLGKRLLKDIEIDNCTKEIDGTLWQEYCTLYNNTHDRDYVRNPEQYRSREKNWNCDPYFQGSLKV